MNDTLSHACKGGRPELRKVISGRGKRLNNSLSVRLLLAAGLEKRARGPDFVHSKHPPGDGGATFSLVLFRGTAFE